MRFSGGKAAEDCRSPRRFAQSDAGVVQRMPDTFNRTLWGNYEGGAPVGTTTSPSTPAAQALDGAFEIGITGVEPAGLGQLGPAASVIT